MTIETKTKAQYVITAISKETNQKVYIKNGYVLELTSNIKDASKFTRLEHAQGQDCKGYDVESKVVPNSWGIDKLNIVITTETSVESCGKRDSMFPKPFKECKTCKFSNCVNYRK